MKTYLTGEWLVRVTTARQRRTVNYWMTVFWIVMIPVSVVMGWITSVAYVSALSLWALVSGRSRRRPRALASTSRSKSPA